MEIFKAPSVTAVREEDRLKGTSNYQQWKRYMKTFYGIYLNPLIKSDADETAPKEGDQGFDRWQALQAWGCAQIGTSLALKEDNPIPEDANSALQIWASLAKAFDPASASSLLVETLKVLKLSIPNNPTLEEFDQTFQRYRTDIERAKAKGLTLENLYAIIAIQALPSNFSTPLQIMTSNKAQVPDLDTVISTMRGHLEVDGAGSTSRDSALFASTSRSSSRRLSQSNYGKGEPPGPCPACKKTGHWLSDCRDKRGEELRESKRKAREERSKEKEKKKAQVAEEEEEDTVGIAVDESYKDAVALVASTGAETTSPTIIDTGATCHIVKDASLLTNVKSITPARIRGLGGVSVAARAGNLKLKSNLGRSFHLNRVLVLPEASHNLISTARLEDDFATSVTIKNGSLRIFDRNGKLAAEATRTKRSSLFHFQGDVAPDASTGEYSLIASLEKTDPLTAHRRMCHLSLVSTMKLASQSSLSSTNDVNASKSLLHDSDEVKNCEACEIAKAKRFPHPPNSNRSTRRLDLIHSDLLEMPTRSVGGARYIITFLDDKSRYLDIAILGKKSESLDAFKEFVAKVETQTGEKVKRLRSDNGGEYTSSAFSAYCKSKGIEHEWSTAYTPEENARAEAVNETITTRTRAMLLDSGLGKEWWAEAAVTAKETYNLSPHSAIEHNTPFAEYHARQPSYDHLRAFGCEAIVHIPKERRNKLEATAFKGVFIGYGGSRKQYRIMDPSLPPRKAVKVVSAVKFNETIFPLKKDYISGSLKASKALPPSVCPHAPHDVPPSTQILLTRSPSNAAGKQDHEKNESTSPRPSPSDENPHWPLPQIRDLPEQQQSHNSLKVPSASSPISPSLPYSEKIANEPAAATPSPTLASPSPAHISPQQQHLPTIQEEPTPESPDPLDLLGAAAEEESDNPFDAWVRGGAGSAQDYRAFLAGKGAEGVDVETFTLPTDDPRTAKEARASEDAAKWDLGMLEEVHSLIRTEAEGGYGVLEVVNRGDLPRGATILPSKYVYARKRNALGKVVDHRTRLVVMGSQQVEGKDYFETYSPTLKAPSLRLLFALAAREGYILEQSDVSKAYLHGELGPDEQEMYMLLPSCVAELDPSLAGKIVRLKKALYGLKQAGRAWRRKMTSVLIPEGYHPSKSDECFLVHKRQTDSGTEYDYMTIFVDDQIHASKSQAEVDRQKAILKKHFKLKELGTPSQILGIQATKTEEGGWHLALSRYCKSLVDRFLGSTWRRVHLPLDSASFIPPVDTSAPPTRKSLYSSIIGSLIYAAHSVRPDIAYAVGVLSKFAAGPTEEHVQLALRVVRYLGTYPDLGLHYTKDGGDIKGYADASFADREGMRSTSAVVWTMAGAPIIWRSSTQHRAAGATGEAEFLALSEASKDAVWLKSLHLEAGRPIRSPLPLYSDATAALSYANDSSHHRRFRQVRINEQIVKDAIVDGTVATEKVDTAEQLADSLTKAMPREKFEAHRRALHLTEPPPAGSRGGVEERGS